MTGKRLKKKKKVMTMLGRPSRPRRWLFCPPGGRGRRALGEWLFPFRSAGVECRHSCGSHSLWTFVNQDAVREDDSRNNLT